MDETVALVLESVTSGTAEKTTNDKPKMNHSPSPATNGEKQVNGSHQAVDRADADVLEASAVQKVVENHGTLHVVAQAVSKSHSPTTESENVESRARKEGASTPVAPTSPSTIAAAAAPVEPRVVDASLESENVVVAEKELPPVVVKSDDADEKTALVEHSAVDSDKQAETQSSVEKADEKLMPAVDTIENASPKGAKRAGRPAGKRKSEAEKLLEESKLSAEQKREVEQDSAAASAANEQGEASEAKRRTSRRERHEVKPFVVVPETAPSKTAKGSKADRNSTENSVKNAAKTQAKTKNVQSSAAGSEGKITHAAKISDAAAAVTADAGGEAQKGAADVVVKEKMTAAAGSSPPTKRRRVAAEKGIHKVRQVVVAQAEVNEEEEESANEDDHDDDDDDEHSESESITVQTKLAKRALRDDDDDEDRDYGDNDDGEETNSEFDAGEDDYKPKKGKAQNGESSSSPKKRGRPKGSVSKTPKKERLPRESSSATTTPAVAKDEKTPVNSARKSVGVGPLTSGGNRRSAAAAVAAGVSGDDAESASPRKRGRPPKNPRVFSAEGVDDPYAFQMPDDEDAKKRGRGRPKKNPMIVDEENAATTQSSD